MFGLGFILLLLLINFFAFNAYFEDVEMLKETSQVNAMQKEKLLTLKNTADENNLKIKYKLQWRIIEISFIFHFG